MSQPSPTANSTKPAGGSARPFIKWAGGKQQLLSQFEQYFPRKFGRYIEPFLGGGAVYFHLWNANRISASAALWDNNGELINAYRIVRDRVEELVEHLRDHQLHHSEQYYYKVRKQDRIASLQFEPVERAARTLYLNKTCFNGLYRVNSKGQFNVPIGRYDNPRILDEDRLRIASKALHNAQFEVRDFRAVVEVARPGDFLYFDPPYHPLSDTSNFTSYTAGSFGMADQRDLADVFAALDAKGCYCMLSNSHTPFVLELYDSFRVELVQATRSINSDASSRGRISEVLILNY